MSSQLRSPVVRRGYHLGRSTLPTGGRDASEEEEAAGGRKRQGRSEAEAKEKDVAREVAGAGAAAALARSPLVCCVAGDRFLRELRSARARRGRGSELALLAGGTRPAPDLPALRPPGVRFRRRLKFWLCSRPELDDRVRLPGTARGPRSCGRARVRRSLLAQLLLRGAASFSHRIVIELCSAGRLASSSTLNVAPALADFRHSTPSYR